jgi:Flp pilus assembly protein TadG
MLSTEARTIRKLTSMVLAHWNELEKEATMRLTKKNQKAQGLVEFALISPLLIMVLFAIVDFGWVIFNYSQVYNGLREGVRYGAVVGFGSTNQIKDCTGIKTMVVAQAQFSGLTTTSSDIKIWYDDGRALDDSTTVDYTNASIQTPAANRKRLRSATT